MANVYLKIEIKQRELLSKILIGMHCALKKNTVYLGNVQDYLFRDKFSPGVFLDKSISRTKSKLLKLQRIKSNGHVITCIDEEMGVTHENYYSFSKLRFSNDTLKQTSAIFCYGQFDFNFLRNKYKKFKNIFHKTGSARVDVCNILKKFDKRNRLSKFPKKKYIIIGSNFGTIVSKKPLWKIIEDRKHYYDHRKKTDEKKIESQNFRFGRDVWKTSILKEYLDLIQTLSNSFKDYNIIVRPHPSEMKKGWKSIIKNNQKNVFILDDYTSSEVLNFAEFMIHSGCTTALEAKLLGTPVISFNPIKDKKYERKFFTNCGREFTKKRKLLNFIKSKKYKNLTSKKNFINEMNDKFFMNKEYSSSERISSVIQELINKNKLDSYDNSLRNKINLFIISLKNFIKNIILINKDTNYFEHKFEKLNNREVHDIIELYKKTNKNFYKIRYKIISKRLLKIWC